MSTSGDPTTKPTGTDPVPFAERYFRKGLGLRQEVRGEVNEEYCSEIVFAFKEHDYVQTFGETTFQLAREFGFCYGVERSVDYAYETLKRFPGRRIILTGEIIHNPRVNTRLRELGIRFYGDPDVPDASALVPDDVVILPAFGVATGAFDEIRESGAVMVDTTCGSVLNVWKNVERYSKAGMTSLMHGKVNHEETRATVSRVGMYEGGHYLVVFDMDDAEFVADYIRNGGDREAFRARFPVPHTSEGFDPDIHLARMGVANQTTMLAGESLAIARLMGEALDSRYGDASDPARFRSFDTICSATQERQDAMVELLEEDLDLLLVIGGYNSSNTGHLAEMAVGKVRAWHITGPECLVSAQEIRHKPVGAKDEATDTAWLPDAGPLRIGITAGASTPDAVIGAVVQRVLEIRGTLAEGEPLDLGNEASA